MKNNNAFVLKVEALVRSISQNCLDQKKAELMKKNLQAFKKALATPATQGRTLKKAVEIIDTAFQKLQNLTQSMCLASEAYLLNNKEMLRLRYQVIELNEKVLNKKNTFLAEFVKILAKKNNIRKVYAPRKNSGSIFDKII